MAKSQTDVFEGIITYLKKTLPNHIELDQPDSNVFYGAKPTPNEKPIKYDLAVISSPGRRPQRDIGMDYDLPSFQIIIQGNARTEDHKGVSDYSMDIYSALLNMQNIETKTFAGGSINIFNTLLFQPPYLLRLDPKGGPLYVFNINVEVNKN